MKAAEKIETAVVVFTEDEKKALKEYSITPEEVAEKAKEYMLLKVTQDDEESYGKVKAAQMVCVHTRTGVDKRRKKLNEDDQARIKARNEAAKKLVAPLAPVEEYLDKELGREDGRKAEIKAKKAQEELERVQGIRAKITAIGSVLIDSQGKTAAEILTMIDTLSVTPVLPTEYQEFEAEANTVKAGILRDLKKAHEGRLIWEEEQAKAKAEAERLAKQKAEQEAEAKRLEEIRKGEEEKTKKEREAIEAEKRKIQEQLDRIEFERKTKELAEIAAKVKVEQEEKERKDREAKAEADRVAKEEADRKEAERKAALAPDKEKLITWANSLLDLTAPELRDGKAGSMANAAIVEIYGIAHGIIEEANKL